MRMKRIARLFLVAFIPATLLIIIFLQAQARQDTAVPAAPLPLISQLNPTDAGLNFVLNTAVFQSTAAGTIQVDGLDQVISTPGAPMLPYYVTFIAVPPEADVSVNVTAAQVTERPLAAIATAAQPILSYVNESADALFPATAGADASAAAPDAAIYTQDAPYPTAVYELSDPMYYRDVRLVQLKLYPLRYNPVQQRLVQAQQLQVEVTFTGVDLSELRPSPTANDAYLQALMGQILNPDQAAQWRSLPTAVNARETAVTLPIGQPTLKIEVARDGIYEIGYSDLQQASLLPLNPNTIQMMHRGETVAYQFVGDADAAFEPGEKIRFFGWAINESRYEKQLVRNNVFWLWDGGAPSPIATTPNLAGTGQLTKTNYLATITREDEKFFFSTWTNQWDKFPNEPDSYYWDRLIKPAGQTLPYTFTRQITLPDPVLDPAQPDARYVIELMTRESGTAPKTITYHFFGCLNAHPDCEDETWGQPGDPIRGRNVSITNTVPMTALVNGVNNVQIVDATVLPTNINSDNFLNRITVTYMRHLIAQNNQLIFNDEVGNRELWVSGFAANNPNDVLVWDVSSPRQPVAVAMNAGNIGGSAGNYTYKFAVNQPPDAQFIAATTSSVLSGTGVITFSRYIPPSLSPTGGADWIAISHADFMAHAQTLAAHRSSANFGGLQTFVADVQDVINQYGYGLPLPGAIHSYLQDALFNWTTAPAYVVLIGDGLVAPRNLPCVSGCTDWDSNAVSYVPTDLMFVDRFQGLVPSDHSAVLLSGDDLLPDMAIGRIPAKTAVEAQSAVAKIILYEQNQLTPAAWQKTVLFVADDPDNGGDFCTANFFQTGPLLPDTFNQVHLCLEASTTEAVNALRQDMTTTLSAGASILNYRGHGGVEYWGGNPPILTVRAAVAPGDMTDTFWNNPTKPVTILSADCLDGNFSFPGRNALSERTLTANNKGSAAHWGSAGLGYDSEHTVLLEGFYTGLFDAGQTAVGDATNFAKLHYTASPSYEISAMYNFILQGDPAMQLFRPDVSLSKTTPQPSVELGSTAVFNLNVRNDGIYPVKATISDTLPTGLSYTVSSASAPYQITVNGRELVFSLGTGLAQGESAMIVVTTTAVALQNPATNVATVNTSGNDLNPGNETSSATINIFQEIFKVYLPNIIK
jgi:uncharacterized repeat protein (TIGR01451 family)